MKHALIVNADVDAAAAMSALAVAEHYTVATARTLREAKRQMALQSPDIVLAEMNLPDGLGAALLDDVELLGPSRLVLVTHGATTLSHEHLAGEFGYLVTPVAPEQLRHVLLQATEPRTPTAGGGSPALPRSTSDRLGYLWGSAPAMQRVYEQIRRVAGTSVPVLITGESGTGKELAARTLHDLSQRAKQPFLAVNCGAISPHLIESEVFGHEKGSFTGADRQHQGFFERAKGGTLFLDEITEMPPSLQVRFLRVLESGTYMRVGSTTLQTADVRVLAATNRDPMRAVAEGHLREDLYYRLQVFPMAMPALREHLDDVPLLAEQFLSDIGQREGHARQFTTAAIDKLKSYAWPGNVRELKHAIHRAYVMADGNTVGDAWLPGGVAAETVQPIVAQQNGGDTMGLRLGMTLAEGEHQIIMATFEHHHRQLELTAKTLGISVEALKVHLRARGEWAVRG
jgi:two-component system, NtrC family, response regulator AtoC